MERAPVSSSTIAAIGYDAESKTLAVEFHSGKVYHYQGVEPEKHQALLGAESIGRHFGQFIKPNYSCVQQRNGQ